MRHRQLAAALLVLLAACGGMGGGEEVARIPLQGTQGGGYAPVRILLRPDMNPLAFNLHADFTWGNHVEAGEWNSYRVEFRGEGGILATREFQVNSPEKPNISSSAPPTALVQPLLITDVPGEGEYEIAIRALQPVKVALLSPQLAVRMRVPRAQNP